MQDDCKKLLFSVTSKDCDWQAIRGSGPGGQHKNKVSTGIRCTHRASGAVGIATESRSQKQNRKNAFVRMAETDKFKKWHKLETAKKTGELDRIEQEIDKAMAPRHLKIEGKQNGKWVPLPRS